MHLRKQVTIRTVSNGRLLSTTVMLGRWMREKIICAESGLSALCTVQQCSTYFFENVGRQAGFACKGRLFENVSALRTDTFWPGRLPGWRPACRVLSHRTDSVTVRRELNGTRGPGPGTAPGLALEYLDFCQVRPPYVSQYQLIYTLIQ
jgi:hypothetical protein